jgi:hypothetical protein
MRVILSEWEGDKSKVDHAARLVLFRHAIGAVQHAVVWSSVSRKEEARRSGGPGVSGGQEECRLVARGVAAECARSHHETNHDENAEQTPRADRYALRCGRRFQIGHDQAAGSAACKTSRPSGCDRARLAPDPARK